MSFLIVEVNAETGEIIERQATSKEIEDKLRIDEELRQEAEAKAAKQANRQALLEKLGITEEEAKLLLGGN